MALNTNIGIDIDGMTSILFEKGYGLPCEESFMLEINIKDSVNEITLDFYKGIRLYSKDNILIGQLTLINAKTGKIEIKCNVTQDLFKINIDGLIKEYSFVNEKTSDEIDTEILIRDTLKARTDFINYVNQTLNPLDQIKDKIHKEVIDNILFAKQIIFVEDVTIDEYKEVQQQIERWVNPVLENLSSKDKHIDNFFF